MQLEDFFNQISEATKSLGNTRFPLYRGHSDSSYKLLPTLLRQYPKTGYDVWTLENVLFYDFKSLVGPRVKFDNSWEQLYAMRHEGIPTRLLDWTENIGTAIFFALDSDVITEPHIWILNPNTLNKENSTFGPVLINPDVDLQEYGRTYAVRCLDTSIEITANPIAVYPTRSNDRIFAQRGLFTIHGCNNDPLEISCASHVCKVEIPELLIPSLKKLLVQFGLNKYSVYPDLKGLSEYLKQYYVIEQLHSPQSPPTERLRG